MKIPIAKPWLNESEAQNAYDVVLSGWVTQGPQVEKFEELTAKFCGAKYAIAVSNCTVALELSLIAAGVKPGDEVICPSMSFIATANCVVNIGATPIFAEVNKDFNLDIHDVKNKITSKTKAIILVHQIGLPGDIDAFSELCTEKKLTLIEDAACAIGSRYKGRKIGSHSNFVCFSYHPRKIITTGDGGMILTNDEAVAEQLRLLRQHGMSINDNLRHKAKNIIFEEYLLIGRNCRMTDIQAAIGIAQMLKLPEIIAKRRSIALRYNESFRSIEGLILPRFEDEYFSNFQSYSLLLTDKAIIKRNELMNLLLSKGIATRRGVVCSHLEKAYLNHFDKQVHLPKSEFYSLNSIIIPLYPTMTNEEVSYVCSEVRRLLTSV